MDELTGTVDMGEIVDALDPDRKKPEIAYEFSNGRKFERPTNPYEWAEE